METSVPPSRVRYLRHLHLSGNPHLKQWAYLKHRKNPAGVRGRPRSPVPLAQRRKHQRAAYGARLAARGLVYMRLLLPTDAAARLRALAAALGQSPGELVAARLAPPPQPPEPTPAT